MSHTIVMLPEAEQEASEASVYYEEQKEGLGVEFLNALEHALLQLKEHPQHYTYISSEKTIRSIALRRFPYYLIFEIHEDRVVVFSVHHHKRKLRS